MALAKERLVKNSLWLEPDNGEWVRICEAAGLNNVPSIRDPMSRDEDQADDETEGDNSSKQQTLARGGWGRWLPAFDAGIQAGPYQPRPEAGDCGKLDYRKRP